MRVEQPILPVSDVKNVKKTGSNLGAMTPWRASEKSLNIQWFLTSSPVLDLSLNKIEGKFAFDFYITVLVKTGTDVRS